MSYHLGVDVGTTYTAAAVGRDGRVEAATLGTRSVSVPTVVCLAGDQLLVGEPAARRAVTDPHRVAREFKRRVGDPTPLLLGGSPVSAELCMARVVEWVVAQVSATEGGPPASLALTHPAGWGEYKLDLLRQGLRHVGLTVDRFVAEPVAAATAYAAQRPLAPGTVIAVYDLGGGTFDAALVRAGTGAAGAARAAGAPSAVDGSGDANGADGAQIIGRPDGVERLGGIDFDHAVFRHVLGAIDVDPDRLDADDPRAAAGLAQLRVECVAAKEALSHETDVSIPVMLPQRHTEVRLTRNELEAMIRPALGETIVALRRAVTSAGTTVDEVAAVLLVGGSSRIPLVGQLVGAELGRPVAVDARPKDAISLGAALVAMAGAGSPTRAVPPIVVPAPPGDAPTAPLAATSGDVPTAPLAAATSGDAPTVPLATPASGDAPTAPLPVAGADTTAPFPAPPPPPVGPGPVPPPPPPSGPRRPARPRRALVAALAALVVLAGGAGLAALAGGDDPETTSAGDPQDDPSGSDDGSDGDDGDGDDGDTTRTTTSTGGVVDDPGGSGSSGVAIPDPLPGDDWSDAARAQFVDDCSTGIAAQLAVAAGDPVAVCGCVYDDVSTSSDFAAFNEQWTAEDFDPGSEVGQDLTGALLSCATATGG